MNEMNCCNSFWDSINIAFDSRETYAILLIDFVSVGNLHIVEIGRDLLIHKITTLTGTPDTLLARPAREEMIH